MSEVRKCLKCGSLHVVKNGKKRSHKRGLVQRYICLDCATSFY